MDLAERNSLQFMQSFQQKTDLFANETGVGGSICVRGKLSAGSPINDEHIRGQILQGLLWTASGKDWTPSLPLLT